MNKNIDFVVTWVDGNDLLWQERKEKYSLGANKTLNSDARFRDWDIFKYWFRAVERYAPWVNKIFLITEGHIPDWLNLKHPKLVHIKHSDYIDSQYLPTFNSNVIELNIQNIKDLSDKFVLFNDDMFINNYVTSEDFFLSGLPRDCGIFSPIVPHYGCSASIVLNNLEIINKYFNQRDVLKKSFSRFYNLKYKKHLIKNICTFPWKPILGFYDNHIPVSYNRSYFQKVLDLENNEIKKLYTHRFRQKDDISHWLIRYFQLCEGSFIPRSPDFGIHYLIQDDFDELSYDIKHGNHKVICLNDSDTVNNFSSLKASLVSIFEEKFYEKSSFEK